MKNKVFKIVITWVFILLVGTLLAGCGKNVSESEISYAGPMLDNVLAGMKDKDYNKFSKDLSNNFKNAITKDAFDKLVADFGSKIGEYKTRSFSGAATTNKDNKAITDVVYIAKYSKETSDVLITISFSDNNGTKMIEGLVFDSPNLRKQ